MIARLPIRTRLALAFTIVMAVLIAIAGVLLTSSVERNFDQILAQSLQTRAADAGVILQNEGPTGLTGRGEGFAQVLTLGGAVVGATPGLPKGPLITPGERRRAATRPVFVDRRFGRGEDNQRFRLLATAARVDGQPRIVVVGASLDDRNETLTNLKRLLFIGGPIALALASLAGFGVASAALRPVEAMRRRAAGISGATPGERLPTSPANDELRRLAETLNEMLGRIDRTMARERAFVSDASHELRTPLAILKGELEVASHPARTTRELREAIASASEEADRLARLSEDLLVVARADQGGLPVRQELLSAEDLLGRVADRAGARVAAAGRSLSISSPPGLVVWGDELRLEQALDNLVDNALRHGADSIQITAEQTPGGTRLSVSDRGAGVADAFAEVAFERFTRADGARGRGGSGLGLSIVMAIARGHGGDAGIRNEVASDGRVEGATSWIEVPDAPDALDVTYRHPGVSRPATGS
ncbi:MAG: hypothetical protein HYX33_02745 [Actinobacteria bacterium]|nr:hypothetical protein [Actinomycetota bacterium]